MSTKAFRPPPTAYSRAVAGEPASRRTIQPSVPAQVQVHVAPPPRHFRTPPVASGSSGTVQGYFPGGLIRIPGAAVLQAKANRPIHAGDTAIPLPSSFLTPRQGHPLPNVIRQKMEAVFRSDLSSVRVHVGPEASAIGALAFTTGERVFFAAGQYQPNTQRGLHLLGHELAHVIQQRSGRVRNPFGTGLAVVRDAALEAEADRMGRMAATQCGLFGGTAQPVVAQALARPGVVQLMDDEDYNPDDEAPILEIEDFAKSALRKGLSFTSKAIDWMKGDTPKNKITGRYICHICGNDIKKGQSIDMDHLPPWHKRIEAYFKVKEPRSEDDVSSAELTVLYNMRGSVFAHESCNRGHMGEGNWKQRWASVVAWFKNDGGECIDKNKYNAI
ncbi:DUF4157 domain-containing protein [Azospirillum sp. TSO22-1]|uniref:DUF4157 domain-containing protein n=1 Tax=Azospirillum sp. TSO22-1 TaxID=716789 RepID=UPI000D64ECF5|nr:DUF4157 domain-containing protein [Azospirillum sp. TSO22-1]